jgi:NTE family protein
MSGRALVLGGGGPVGIAWETGVLAGLAAEGVTLADADLIVGTSAGSFVGADIAGGDDAQAMAEAQIALSEAERTGAAPAMAFDPAPFVNLFATVPVDQEPSAAICREFGALSQSGAVVPEAAYLMAFQSFAKEGRAWPARFACTAVDVDSGAFKVLRAGDGAPLAHAIAASCSVPGIFPPVPINGRRYMDGGVRSPTCADVAAGHARVVTFAVITGTTGPFVRNALEREALSVRERGGHMLIVTPDPDSLAAFGPNLMDAKNRVAITRAGVAQGRAEAARLRAFWLS